MLKVQTSTDLILVVGAMHAGSGVHKGPPGGIADCLFTWDIPGSRL